MCSKYKTYNLRPSKPTSINYTMQSTLLENPDTNLRLDTKIEHKRWTRVWRWDCVDEDESSPDERSVGNDDGFDFPLRREVSLAESLRRRAKVPLPKFCLENVATSLQSPLLNCFPGKMASYQKRSASVDLHRPHKPTRRAPRGAPPGLWALGGSPLVIFSTYFIY